MRKTTFPFLQQVFIYVALFIGIKAITGVILQLLVLPLAPSVLNLLQSPNYTFSPAAYTSIVIQLLGFIAALFLTIRYIKLFFPIANSLAFSTVATIFYILYTFLPTIRFMFLNQTARQYLFTENLQIGLISISFNLALFLIFFLASMYLLKKK